MFKNILKIFFGDLWGVLCEQVKTVKKLPLNKQKNLDFVYIQNSSVHIFPAEIHKLT